MPKLLYFRYLIHNGSYSPTSLAPHRQDWLVTCVDILVFTVFCVQVITISDDKYISPQISSFPQMLVNTLLVVGSLNHISSHLFPWLCVTATCVILAIVSLDESMKSCRKWSTIKDL